LTPNLTPEQKEHLKIAHRANMRIEETWSLFCMYLSQDKKPIDALELARQAVCVWADWMDENEVEPPDIPRPDFAQQMTDAMKQVVSSIPRMGQAVSQLQYPRFAPPTGIVDAEFVPAEQHEAAPTPAALSNPESLTGQNPPTTKE
jgi:hypothetical protein